MQTIIFQKNSWLKVAGALFFIILTVGCKTTTGTVSSGAEIQKTEEVFFTSLLDRSLQYNTFSARLNLEFSGMEQQFNSRVQLKMIHNDRIQLSVQPFLGIEMLRIEFSSDSIKIVDRINKRFVADNYLPLKREMDIDLNFQNVQALISNRLFVPGEQQVTANNYRQFSIKKNNRSAELKLKGREGTLYTFLADGEEKLLATQIDYVPKKQRLSVEYSQFQAIDNQLFPMKLTARLSSGDQQQGITHLSFSNPLIDNPLTMDFAIPSGYSRVTLEQIIKSLDKL